MCEKGFSVAGLGVLGLGFLVSGTAAHEIDSLVRSRE